MTNYQNLLSELLAIIHADGGHYEDEHGTEKAVTDAITKIYKMKAQQVAQQGVRAGEYCTCGTEWEYHDGQTWLCMYCDRPHR